MWLVNFDYMDAGYIPELKTIKEHDGYKISTAEGLLIFNSKQPDAREMAKLFDFVMNLDDKHLKEGEPFKQYIANTHNPNILKWNDDLVNSYVAYHHLEDSRRMFIDIAAIERLRRKVMRNYNLKHPIKAIKGFLKQGLVSL